MVHEVKHPEETKTRQPIAPERPRVPVRMPEPEPPHRRPVRWLYWMAGAVVFIAAVGITVVIALNRTEPTLTYLDHTTYGQFPTEAWQVIPRPEVRELAPQPAPAPVAAPLSFLDMYFPDMGDVEAFLPAPIDTTTQGLWPTEAWQAAEWKGRVFVHHATTGRWPNEAFQLAAWEGLTFLPQVTAGTTAVEAYDVKVQPPVSKGPWEAAPYRSTRFLPDATDGRWPNEAFQLAAWEGLTYIDSTTYDATIGEAYDLKVQVGLGTPPFVKAPTHYIQFLDPTTNSLWPAEAYQLAAWDGLTFLPQVTTGATAVEAYDVKVQPETAIGPFPAAPTHYIRFLDHTTYGQWPTEAWQALEWKGKRYLPHETQDPTAA